MSTNWRLISRWQFWGHRPLQPIAANATARGCLQPSITAPSMRYWTVVADTEPHAQSSRTRCTNTLSSPWPTICAGRSPCGIALARASRRWRNPRRGIARTKCCRQRLNQKSLSLGLGFGPNTLRRQYCSSPKLPGLDQNVRAHSFMHAQVYSCTVTRMIRFTRAPFHACPSLLVHIFVHKRLLVHRFTYQVQSCTTACIKLS